MKRRFSNQERDALYLYQQGKCAICGDDLLPGWHADHVSPHSIGAPTDVLNAQALCPKCNLKKGSSITVVPRWPDNKPLRAWQIVALGKFNEKDEKNFLTYATPGAGKTTFALKVAHSLLMEGRIDRVVIVCPTTHLKQQWKNEAHGVGINLNPDWESGYMPEAKDMHGIIATYHQVARNPDVFRRHCHKPTLVIFDEVHHAGEDKTWGDSIRHAFDPAVNRLLTTGTPFRSDNNPIPYVKYDGTGKSIADYTYDYGQALTDRVCRPVLFPSYEGNMEWLKNGELIRAHIEDTLPLDQRADLMRTALSTSLPYLPKLITDADQQLSQIQKDGHPDAAGLIIAKDQWHARNIVQMMTDPNPKRNGLGMDPQTIAIAVSDDPDSSSVIKAFRDNGKRWIVAVKMISEGVDIPRLRVAVYATNVITELYFRQAVGRVVRMLRGIEEQSAYFYIPAIPELIEFAQKIKEERSHQLREEIEKIIRCQAEEENSWKQEQSFTLLHANAIPGPVVYDGDIVSRPEIEEAQRYKTELDLIEPTAKIAKLLALDRARTGRSLSSTQAEQPISEPLQDRKIELRRIIRRMVAEMRKRTGMEYNEIHKWLWDATGGNIKTATEEQLIQRIKLLDQVNHAGQ